MQLATNTKNYDNHNRKRSVQDSAYGNNRWNTEIPSEQATHHRRDRRFDFETENIAVRMEEFSTQLRQKIDYSVALLRKAEHIAMAYDNENGYYLAFSGGKDSQALYHIAKLAGVKFKAHMNLTSIDPPEVIRFVKHNYPDVELIKPKDSIYNIAVRKHILPTKRLRWCCQEFKETAGAGKVTLIGIRHEESSRRANRNEVELNNRKFSGTLEGLEEYRKTASNNKRLKPTEINITNANGERTLGCIRGKESLLISPIIHWTERDVWEFLNKQEIPHCSLYDKGQKRIGCILCPMSSRRQKAYEIERYPQVKKNWIKAIKKLLNDRIWTEKNTFCDIDVSAEYSFDWWISGKPYRQWYSEKFLQTELDFESNGTLSGEKDT